MIPESILRRRGRGDRPIAIQPSRRADILRIINSGWYRALARPGVRPAAREVELTGHLLTGMQAAVNDRVVHAHKRISVLPGTESRSGPEATPSGLTDISIHLRDIRERSRDHGPHAIIECKRVAGSGATLCRLYVVEGMDRFKTGKYADRHAVAFMAGYVLSGSVDAAACGINRYLSRQRRAVEHLTSCTVLAEGWARTSLHRRQPAAAPIDVHHAFLTFQPGP